MEELFAKGLAGSTQRVYRCGQRKFVGFCGAGGFQAVPASESTLCKFVAYLTEAGLKHRTIRVYLSAVRHLHIAEGERDLFTAGFPRLQYVLQGVKRVEAEKGVGKRERLPISPDILRKVKTVWESESTPAATMLWAACCLGFFGFLRSGEMTVPTESEYDPGAHLSVKDIAVDDPVQPRVVWVFIKQLKTDPFRKGIHLFLGRTQSDICPVKALVNYLVARGKKDGPLFVFPNGDFLTRQRLVSVVREAIKKAGLDPTKYCGHSFRIGAATAAARNGLEDSVIKTLGRWRSLAYLECVQIPRDQLAGYSQVLCS